MRFNIIGAGSLGKNVALALSSAGIASPGAFCNSTLASAEKAVLELKFGSPISRLSELPPAEIIWITANDDAIESIVNELNHTSVLKPGSFVIHCSGVLNSAVLSPLRNKECLVASIHPLKAFRSGYLDINAFRHVDCVVEGDPEVCLWLNEQFESLEANVIHITPQGKALYHAAASIASNYLVTLASASNELLVKAGISAEDARDMICNLMQTNINNLRQVNQSAEALTGPLMRGDINTLSRHLAEIENAKIKDLYRAAGLLTLDLTNLDPEKTNKIKALLEH